MENQTTEGNGVGEQNQGNPAVEIQDGTEELKHVKSVLSGETRKNSELNKQIIEMKGQIDELSTSLESRLSVDEKKQYEEKVLKDSNQKMQTRLEELERVNKTRESRDLKLQILKDNDLQDIDLVNILGGESVEAFTDNVKAYIERTSKLEQQIKTNLVNGQTPAAGNTPAVGKEIQRQVFLSLSPAEQMNTVRQGIKIID